MNIVKDADLKPAQLNVVNLKKPRPLDFDPSIYLRNDYVVIDFETTNKNKGNPVTPANHLVFGAWSCGERHPAFLECTTRERYPVHGVFGTEYEQRELLDAIAQSSFIVAYHAKFECGWLRRCGVELRDLIIYDPMLAEYVIYGNTKPKEGLSLDATLKRYGIQNRKMRYVSALIEAGVCPSEIYHNDLREYGVRDVRSTHELFLRQRAEIFRTGRERVLYGRCLVTPMLADIEARGVHLDEERVHLQHRRVRDEWVRSDGLLQEFTGAVNWDSPKQVTELLYDRLGFEEPKDYRGKVIRAAAGGRTSKTDHIDLLKSSTIEQRKFKDLWGVIQPLKKLRSSLETMKNICEQSNGHFFAQFNQAVTQNHRLSSTGGEWGLQLQNQDRSLKKLFCSGTKGRLIIEGDCPQLEFRTVIDLTRDPVGLSDVLARADIHSLTSSVTGFSRQDSKPHTFKPIYGGKSGPPRLRKYYDAFRDRYRLMYNGQMGWVYTVLETGQLRTPTGLVFYWPDTEVTSSGYITNTTKIFNYPVSMLAGADIAQLSLVLVWHGMRGWDGHLCNTVHDSGIGDIPSEESGNFVRLMVQSYTVDIYEVLDKLYDIKFSVPLGLGIKQGTHWGEGEESKYEPDTRFKFTSDKPTAIKLD